ncbi:5-bromo-4-chloroindolyl phosphate hydrolysis family protein [Ascidiaceihabitans sp.]|uniref:5-bromo-4-chloroindolyl phosphate hydrolysis family protein n=1 Tax=Ascidiaceihabitans sp. TaxID=1872644 RepID=UPI003298F3BA
MAKRFGGQYSPDGETSDLDAVTPGAYDKADVSPVGARANVLFMPAIPMVFLSLNDGAIGLVAGLGAAAVLTLAAWLLRGGLQAEAAFNARKVARKPGIPRKMFASALTGIGIAMAAFRVEPGVIAPVLYGLAAMGLHVAAFGIDPLRSKGMAGIDTHQQDRVAKVVDKAEAYLDEMTDAMRRANDRRMEQKLQGFQNKARDLIRTVEEDPRDLTAARKYLGVYLKASRDATIKFADIYSRTQNARAREDYATLLDDLSAGFDARTKKLLLEDRGDLNVEIDVLRERLQREGVPVRPSDEI